MLCVQLQQMRQGYFQDACHRWTFPKPDCKVPERHDWCLHQVQCTLQYQSLHWSYYCYCCLYLGHSRCHLLCPGLLKACRPAANCWMLL